MINKLDDVVTKLDELDNHITKHKNSIKSMIQYVQSQNLEPADIKNKEFINGNGRTDDEQN